MIRLESCTKILERHLRGTSQEHCRLISLCYVLLCYCFATVWGMLILPISFKVTSKATLTNIHHMHPSRTEYINITKQSNTKPCAYITGNTLHPCNRHKELDDWSAYVFRWGHNYSVVDNVFVISTHQVFENSKWNSLFFCHRRCVGKTQGCFNGADGALWTCLYGN